MFKKVLVILIVLVAISASTKADRRKYVWTYQTTMVAQDHSEFEFYQTTKLNDIDKWEYRIEIEHGLSPKADLAVYQIFTQTEGESFKWDAVQFRVRYRLTEPGSNFFNPILYVEYNRKTDLKAQNKFEAKLLLGHNFDKTNLSVNPVFEFFWAPGDPIYETGLDIGLSYSPTYKFSIGIESTSRQKYETDKDTKYTSYFGPTISYASGDMFYTLGYAWGVTDKSDDARIRFIMGIGI